MPKHTPAPWRAVWLRPKMEHVQIRAGKDTVIADIHPANFDGDKLTLADNARLIAAAPKMAELLQRVVEHFAHTDAPLGCDARALLARIEGE